MEVFEELTHLNERLERGEITPARYAQEKQRLQERSILRRQALLSKMGEASRRKLEIVRGTARNVTTACDSGGCCEVNKATLEVDGREIELTNTKGGIRISEGDTVLIVGRARGGPVDPLRTGIYYNETTESGSLEATWKIARKIRIAASLAGLVALAILTTATLAIRSERALLSGSGAFHLAIYIASIAGGGATLVLSLGLWHFAAAGRKMCEILRSILSGKFDE